ncbi:hypothetical protein ANANG_G00269430 [Anguilla anguilla]|uniref:Uncharacterized protein n=1 Tax=Anguilla anguilla TaxID=7936 RepID=A0A9D3RLU4_ANGAN|nr:hypothetical protein ANANG_G00269430 [Anguilla anguilla]
MRQVPHQVSALTFYRYDQPIVDYCQAHQSLHLNMGFEGPPQGLERLEDLGPRDGGTIQTVAIPTGPAASLANPRTTPTATPSGGPRPRLPARRAVHANFRTLEPAGSTSANSGAMRGRGLTDAA